MSTILNALKRLDEQRRAEASPKSLQEQVLARDKPPPAPRSGPHKLLLGGVGALAALAIVGVGWLATREGSRPEAPRSEPVVARIPVASASAPPASRSVTPAAGIAPDAASRELTPKQSATSPVEPPAQVLSPSEDAALARTPAPPAEAPPISETAPRPQEAASTAAPSVERAASAAAPVEPARAAALASAEAPGEAREPADTSPAPAAVPSAAPTVAVERTQWHPSPDKRSASVRVGEDGEVREMREGDEWGGVVVKEIRPSSVTFVRGDAEFERPVGGS